MSNESGSKSESSNSSEIAAVEYRMERPSQHHSMNQLLEDRDFDEKKVQMDEATSADSLETAIGAAASVLSNLDGSNNDDKNDPAYEYFIEKNGATATVDLHGTFQVNQDWVHRAAEKVAQQIGELHQNVDSKNMTQQSNGKQESQAQNIGPQDGKMAEHADAVIRKLHQGMGNENSNSHGTEHGFQKGR
tara:strand:- start:1306 stop:1875 length:570 start_codon:yes stop_codon:yes gene_type:complete